MLAVLTVSLLDHPVYCTPHGDKTKFDASVGHYAAAVTDDNDNDDDDDDGYELGMRSSMPVLTGFR